jgi:hypothetical protein
MAPKKALAVVDRRCLKMRGIIPMNLHKHPINFTCSICRVFTHLAILSLEEDFGLFDSLRTVDPDHLVAVDFV